MSPGGQGALVNVCEGKPRPQHPEGHPAGLRSQRRARMAPGRAATGGHQDTGSLRGLGRPQKPLHQRGKQGPERARA